MKVLAIVSLCFALSSCGSSENKAVNIEVMTDHTDWNCDEHFAYGQPIIANSDVQPICHYDYMTAYHTAYKHPFFTAHELTVNEATTYVDRENTFINDPLLDASFIQAVADDFVGTGYDRGHYVPWGDTGLYADAVDTNVYTNVAPMLANFNRGAWLTVENWVRSYAEDNGVDVYVITGAVLTGTAITSPTYIGDNVSVPTAFYKIVVDKQNEYVQAFLLPHTSYSDFNDFNIEEVKITVEEIETLTGMDFLPALSSTAQTALQN